MGYRDDEHERALEEVPPFVADPVNWPDGVRVVGFDELGNLGIDRSGVLYWNGRILTVERKLTLSFWQKFSAAIVTVTAALVAISTIAQGVVAYSSWACGLGWYAICP